MYGGIITHSFITCELHLSSLAKSPNQCCKLSLKALWGVDNKIFTFIYISGATGIFIWMVIPHAKKVVPDSPSLVDFTTKLVNSTHWPVSFLANKNYILRTVRQIDIPNNFMWTESCFASWSDRSDNCRNKCHIAFDFLCTLFFLNAFFLREVKHFGTRNILSLTWSIGSVDFLNFYPGNNL